MNTKHNKIYNVLFESSYKGLNNDQRLNILLAMVWNNIDG